MTKKKTFGLYFLAAFLLVFGVVLTFNQPIKDYFVKQASTQQVEHITKKQIAKNNKKYTKKLPAKKQKEVEKQLFDFKQVKSMDTAQVVKAATTAPKKAAQSSLPIIGKLSVPSVGLNLPISVGLSNAVLSAGAGTMKYGQQMGEGNYTLAGHYMTDYGALFSPLEHVNLHAKVIVTDMNKVYTYRIFNKQVVNPYQTDILNDVPGKKIITLVTCADGGKNRWSIQGELTDVSDY